MRWSDYGRQGGRLVQRFAQFVVLSEAKTTIPTTMLGIVSYCLAYDVLEPSVFELLIQEIPQ
jgi:hypothetical protein